MSRRCRCSVNIFAWRMEKGKGGGWVSYLKCGRRASGCLISLLYKYYFRYLSRKRLHDSQGILICKDLNSQIKFGRVLLHVAWMMYEHNEALKNDPVLSFVGAKR